MKMVKSKSRQIFLLVLCLCLLTGLCACGKTTDEKTPTSTAGNNVQPVEQKNEGSQVSQSDVFGSDTEDQTTSTTTDQKAPSIMRT